MRSMPRELPVVTGIGHQIDFTIADLVADRRAATPSAAAELVSPDQQELLNQQRNLETRLLRALLSRVKRGQEALEWLSKRLVHPRRRLMDQSQRLDELSLRLARAAHNARTLKMAKLAEQTARLLRHDPQQALALRHGLCRHQEARLTRAIAQRLAVHRERLAKLGATLNADEPALDARARLRHRHDRCDGPGGPRRGRAKPWRRGHGALRTRRGRLRGAAYWGGGG